ncbi:MAG: thiamine-phosphate kinase [Microbacteriaceae bacterium]|nr:thiamine-phosphate kinase [Microbacteriaceae bacterium]MDR9443819.1 thiamine-phosphate kinase [Microbacteriaceae bacterium]
MSTIYQLGEKQSLKLALAGLRGTEFALLGSGDDAALLKANSNSYLVSTDTMIENHDFRLDFSQAFDLGWKAIASNYSDIAAMGGVPTAAVVAMSVPKDTEIQWLVEFVEGLQAAADSLALGSGIVGGDLATANQSFISVTAFGDLDGLQPVTRSGAKAGDGVFVAGTLGKAAAGLELLQFPDPQFARSYDEFVNIQLRPQPPIELGRLANQHNASAMMDISDGLSSDAYRLAEASGVSIDIDSSSLLGFQAVLEQAALSIEADTLAWVLHGGEDHSLLVTFPQEAEIPRGFKKIGTCQPLSEPLLLDGNPISPKGWDSVKG